jgi:hypothetical protein
MIDLFMVIGGLLAWSVLTLVVGRRWGKMTREFHHNQDEYLKGWEAGKDYGYETRIAEEEKMIAEVKE